MIYGGGFRTPRKVIYFNAVLFNSEHITDADRITAENFGEVILRSESFDFSHTDYYVKEMGRPQIKYFELYDRIETPGILPDLKIKACALEGEYLHGGRRMINIDPGYIALEKVVAASTKNFTHRIFLRDSIYGDLQLYRRKGAYIPLEWTFQDYAFKSTLKFFEEARRILDERTKDSEGL